VRGGQVLLALGAACASAPELDVTELPEVLVVERAAAVAPRAPSCTIAGDGDPGCASLTLVDERGQPFLIFDDAAAVAARFWELPQAAAKAPRLARVEVEARGVSASGWTELSKRSFVVRERVEVAAGLVVEGGTQISLQGLRGDGSLTATVAVPFARPRELSFVIDCDALAYSASRLASVTEPAANDVWRLSPGPVPWSLSPGAPHFLVSMGAYGPVRVLERNAGAAKVRTGLHPFHGAGTAFVSGWVPLAALEPGDPTDRDGHCGILDRHDRCPDLVTARAVEAHVGQLPGEGAVVRLAARLAVSRISARDGHVAVTLDSDVARAANGLRIWVPEGALSPGACEDDSGCPCAD
jgi:hypothetical protein